MARTFLVSGAGSGIGRAIALGIAAASEDHELVLLGRRREVLEETLQALPRPRSHSIVAVDIRDAQGTRDAFARLDLPSRNMCGVIANAGVGGPNQYGPGDQWNEVISVNLTGTYVLVNEVLPALRRRTDEFGHVVLTASILARLGVPGYSAYCASKAGLLGLMRSWASELAREKVLVNAICPGWVETEMAREGIQGYAKATNRTYEQAYEDQMTLVPLGKMSRPEEIAALVAFLVSGRQTSITGQILDINNGALMP